MKACLEKIDDSHDKYDDMMLVPELETQMNRATRFRRFDPGMSYVRRACYRGMIEIHDEYMI